MSKEREAFEAWAYSKKWNIARVRDMALDHYVDDFVNGAWHGWQAKAQAVPEGFVLVNKKDLVKVLNCVSEDWLVDTDSFEEFKKIESLVQDEVNAMIEAQQPSSAPDCPDEP